MSASGMTSVRQPRPLASPLRSALFLAFAALVLLRIVLNNTVLDLVMDYTGDGGSIVAKIHPASWGLLGVAILVALNYRIALTAWERRVTRAILAVAGVAVALIVFCAAIGHSSSTGYLVDDYVLLVMLIPLFAFPRAWRRQLGFLLFGYLTASALVGLAEFATRIHVIPFAETEAAFRPLGLTSHPLAFGQGCVLAMCLACGLKQLGRARWALVLVFVVAIVVSGARIATIAGLLCLLTYALVNAGAGVGAEQGKRRRIIIIVSAVMVLPIALGALLAAGAFTRFQEGLLDANAMSRVDVYSVLGLMSSNELLFGSDINHVRKLILENFGYDSIESSLLVFVVQFGLIGTCILVATLGRLVRTLSKGADISIVLALVSFAVVALSNNALSVKSSDVFMIVTLGIVFRPDPGTAKGLSP